MADQLVPFQYEQGVPHNRGSSLTKEVRRLMGTKPKGRGGKTYGELAAKVWLLKIMKGDFRYFKEWMERNEGKVPDRLAGADGGPIGFDAILQSLDRIYGPEEARTIELKVVGDEQAEDTNEEEAQECQEETAGTTTEQ